MHPLCQCAKATQQVTDEQFFNDIKFLSDMFYFLMDNLHYRLIFDLDKSRQKNEIPRERTFQK